MPLIIEDRIKESTTSTGTGPITLNGAPTGFKPFSSVCSLGDTVYAAIVAVDGSGVATGQWEIGLYTYTGTNTLTRTTVHSSSNSNQPVSFLAGTKQVYIDFTAEQIKKLASTNTDTALKPFGLDPTLFTAIKFQDEFDGSTLDTTKWDDKLWYEAAPAVSNYNVSNGCLNIWPAQLADGSWINRAIPSKFYQIYGYYEIEADLPIGAGLQPAFWLFSHDLDAKPIVDVMKTYGASPWADAQRRFVDFQATVKLPSGVEAGNRRLGAVSSTQDLSSSFHKYGVLWEPSGFTFFMDGIQLGTKIASTAFTARMYPILSLFAGTAGSLSGAPDTTNTPVGSTNPMRINYIRIWQLVNAPAGSDNPASPAPTPTPTPPPPGPTPTPPGPTPGPVPPSGNGPLGQDASLWEMTFEDHFLGNSLDRTKWNQGIYYNGNTPNTWKVENSNLVMCYQPPFKRNNCTIDTDPQGWDIQGPGFTQMYGYYEARIKAPYGQNSFPAFWLFHHDQREIDIMECFTGSGASWHTDDFHPYTMAWTVWKSNPRGDKLGDGNLAHQWLPQHNANGQLPNSVWSSWLNKWCIDLSADYHTYGFLWDESGMRFYFDGQIIASNNNSWNPFNNRTRELDVPMYIMLDFWMENSDSGSCPIGFGPWEMRVDYVRAWRRR